MKKASVLIPAAGRGERFGSRVNKVFCTIAGKPILAHTLSVFESCDAVEEIILIVSENDYKMAGDLVGHFGICKVRHIVIGGAQRQDSVRNGLDKASCEIIAVHDAARPMVTCAMIENSVKAAGQFGACIVAVPVIDTIKSSENGVVSGTVDRSNLYCVQTPQTFRADLLRKAYDSAYADGYFATDDAALVERIGGKVAIVPGSYDNIKITTPSDVDLASMKLGGGEIRTGMGLDVHELVEGRKLIIGGIEIPYEKGLKGHSDADVMLHAIADACLGAAAMGDIGKHFPDTDPKYKGISSLKLLKHVAELLGSEGWQIKNLDATLACQRPKILPYVPSMIEAIADCLDIDSNRVSVKATTTEGLGYIGRGEGITCYAIATIKRA